MDGAFIRLLRRPIYLFMLFFLAWAVVGPALVIGPAMGDRVLADLTNGAATTALLHYALILGITLPASFGFAAASASLELQFTRLSWMLPGLSRRLTSGIVKLMLPAAAAVAFLTAFASGPGLGVAAFGIALFWSASMLFVPDAGAPPAGRLLLAGMFVAFMIRPAWYVAVVTAQPAAVAAIALLAAGVLLRTHTGAHVRRRRIDVPSAFRSVDSMTQFYRQTERGTSEVWRRSMAGASTTTWVRAAAYEMIGAFPRGQMLFIAGHAVMGVIAYMFSPSIVLVVSFNLAFRGIQLRGGIPYPLSRRQHAHVLFLGNLMDIVLLTGIAGATAGLLAMIGVPRVWAEERVPYEMAMSLALIFAVGPLAQWARARGPLPVGAQMQFGRHLIHQVIAWFAAVVSMSVLLGTTLTLDISERLLVIGVVVVASQTVHFLRLRRLHATQDLV